MDLNGKQNYGDYLKLNKILTSQDPISLQLGNEKHDEMLFIIVHQAHELWFKQILHEIDAILAMFLEAYISDKVLLLLSRRLHRIHVIQKILLDQLNALSTLSPMEFLEFRDLLIPASGFQSLQFRLLEIKLGIEKKQLMHCLTQEEQKTINAALDKPSLRVKLNEWLERTPFIKTENFTFWQVYRDKVKSMLAHDKEQIIQNQFILEEDRKIRMKELEKMQSRFETFFDRNAYEEILNAKERSMSFKASQAALFIFLYRDHPILQLPYQILSYCIQIDENLTSWRAKHLSLVQRIIGAKMGTGGSAGVNYLNNGLSTQAFSDLTSLSTFMLSSSTLPELPEDLESQLGFAYKERSL